MGFILLGIFIGIPIIEIAVFIQAGELIGLWPTIGIVILTAIIGTSLMRAQGLQTLARAQAEIDRGEMPIASMFDGICILVAGVLLLTPGFVTDTMGFLLLIPPLRRAVGAGIIAKMMKSGKMRMSFGTSRDFGGGPFDGTGPRGTGGGQNGRGPVIDGDFEDLSNNPQSNDNQRGNDDPHLPPR